jgi:hypothetical protein
MLPSLEGSLEEEGAAAVALPRQKRAESRSASEASKKKKGLLLSVSHGLARRRSG